jgi:hypothetical protein
MRPNKRHCALAALIVAGLSIGWLAAGAFLSFFPMEKLSTDRFIIESQAPFFTKRAQDGQVFLDPVQKTAPALWAWRGQRTFSLRRNPGTHRILVIGESSAEDIGYRLAEFAQEMRKADRLQIVNLGIGAGSLEWTAEKLKEGLQYRPDAIVLVFGHNLFYTHPLVSSWLADILRHFGKGKIGHLLVRAFVQNTSLNIAPPSRIKAFDSLIGDIASRGSPSSIPVLLATLPSNEMVPPGISSGDLSDERYLEAVFLRRSGRRGAAVLKLGNAVTESPRAWWRFCLGLWYLEDGHSLKARQYLGAALSSDPYEHRATPEINDFIRESSRRHGFLLFDADRWIKDKSPYHIPGWRDMADNQHLRRFNFRLEAWHILNALKHEKWPEIHLPPEPQRTQPFHHGVYFWDIFGFFISQLNQLTREGQSPQKITDGVAVFLPNPQLSPESPRSRRRRPGTRSARSRRSGLGLLPA